MISGFWSRTHIAHDTRHTRHTRRTRPSVHSECIKYIKHEWHGIRTVLHYTTGVSLNGPKWFSNSEHAASGFVEGCSYRINIYRNWLKVLVHSNIVLGQISHSLHVSEKMVLEQPINTKALMLCVFVEQFLRTHKHHSRPTLIIYNEMVNYNHFLSSPVVEPPHWTTIYPHLLQCWGAGTPCNSIIILEISWIAYQHCMHQAYCNEVVSNGMQSGFIWTRNILLCILIWQIIKNRIHTTIATERC